MKMHGAYEYASAVSHVTACLRDSLKSGFNDLPDHLQISYECDNNPWQNLFMQDFILVAEFSEHEGPRPLVRTSCFVVIFVFKIENWSSL